MKSKSAGVKATIKQRIAIDRVKQVMLSENSRNETLGGIMRQSGYSDITSLNPKRLTNSKAYKAEIIPLIKRLEMARDRAINRLDATINKATYRDAADSIDKLTKNIQLLSGGATENQLVISISKEIADKNRLPASVETPSLENQAPV